MRLAIIDFWYSYGPAFPEWWKAGYPVNYETAKGIKTAHVEMDEVRSAECPKSIMLRNPEADTLVQIGAQMSAVGDSPFGPAEKWPGWFYDSIEILKDQKLRDENAQQRAIHNS